MFHLRKRAKRNSSKARCGDYCKIEGICFTVSRYVPMRIGTVPIMVPKLVCERR